MNVKQLGKYLSWDEVINLISYLGYAASNSSSNRFIAEAEYWAGKLSELKSILFQVAKIEKH